VKFVRLRRIKIACTPSYADYRCKTNAVTLVDMGHTIRGDWRDTEWEGNQILECG
jgi:hypothetical protein